MLAQLLLMFTETYWRVKWTLWDLNPRPLGCKPSALPAELSAPLSDRVGFSLLRIHTRSTVASRSGPSPTEEIVTPKIDSNFLM